MTRLIAEPAPPPPIKLKIMGEPIAQPRVRAFAFKPKYGKGNARARMYTPDNADGWKHLIFAHANSKRPSELWQGPVRVDAVFWFARQEQWKKLKCQPPPGPLRHFARPDRDNLEKALLDAMTEARMWEDDGQVCCGEIEKYWCAVGGVPGVIVTVTFLPKFEEIE